MNRPARSIEWIVWGGLAVVMVAIFGGFVVSKPGRTVPPLPVYATVPAFSLTNQFGRIISLSDLQREVWVANIIYTRCPGPCQTMTKQLSELQKALSATGPVKLVSLTADPEFDTPEVLKRYGERFGASADHWYFLTGKKLDVYRLATKGLLLAVDEVRADERTRPDDLFVHSTLFVVVDRQGRVRGSFDGTDASSQKKILRAVETLLKEKQP